MKVPILLFDPWGLLENVNPMWYILTCILSGVLGFYFDELLLRQF